MNQLDVFVRVMLKDEDGEPFMGIGVVWLLEGIEKTHSISQAAREMSLSYPKALKMIQGLEDTLQAAVVTRFKGGHQRGGAELTQTGRDFLRRYLTMLGEIQSFARTSFERHFSGFCESAGESDEDAGAETIAEEPPSAAAEEKPESETP